MPNLEPAFSHKHHAAPAADIRDRAVVAHEKRPVSYRIIDMQIGQSVAALSPPLAGHRPPDARVKILEELVAAGSLVREVDPVTGMTVYRELD
jgi:hypothetical protein